MSCLRHPKSCTPQLLPLNPMADTPQDSTSSDSDESDLDLESDAPDVAQSTSDSESEELETVTGSPVSREQLHNLLNERLRSPDVVLWPC